MKLLALNNKCIKVWGRKRNKQIKNGNTRKEKEKRKKRQSDRKVKESLKQTSCGIKGRDKS